MCEHTWVWGARTMYYGWGGGKRGTTHKKLGTTPRFFSRPRPPVRFYTVEALCRYVLSHSTPPFSSSFLIREVHCGKSTQSPAVMQRVCGRHDPHLKPLSSRISLCASPASLLLHRKILFAQNLGIVPTTDSFTHPLTMLHKPTSSLFLRKLPQRVLVGLAHMDFARAKPRQTCRTPYADQLVKCLSLLLRRTTAQTAQLLAVTPLASNKQGY